MATPADDVPPPLPELSGAVAGVAKVAMDLSDLPDQLPYPDADAVLDATVALDEEITRLQAVRAHLLRRVDLTEAYRARGFVTTASWYRDATRRDHGAASRHVRTARRLDDLPQLAAALDEAAVTLDHVDVVSRACKPGRSDAITAADGILTDLARRARPQEVRVACRRIADLVDPDGSESDATDADRGTDTEEVSTAADACSESADGTATSDTGASRDPERGLWLQRSFDGRWRLEAELDGVAGERLFNLLNHLDERDDPDIDHAHRRSHPQRRHDAFARMIKGAEELPDLPTRHGARPRVLLIIDLLTLLGHDKCASRRTRLGSGGVVGRDAALELLREGSVTPILQMGPYRSVTVGRTQRTLPDLASAAPGCDPPSLPRARLRPTHRVDSGSPPRRVDRQRDHRPGSHAAGLHHPPPLVGQPRMARRIRRRHRPGRLDTARRRLPPHHGSAPPLTLTPDRHSLMLTPVRCRMARVPPRSSWPSGDTTVA